jgi:hypothetical protein
MTFRDFPIAFAVKLGRNLAQSNLILIIKESSYARM